MKTADEALSAILSLVSQFDKESDAEDVVMAAVRAARRARSVIRSQKNGLDVVVVGPSFFFHPHDDKESTLDFAKRLGEISTGRVEIHWAEAGE